MGCVAKPNWSKRKTGNISRHKKTGSQKGGAGWHVGVQAKAAAQRRASARVPEPPTADEAAPAADDPPSAAHARKPSMRQSPQCSSGSVETSSPRRPSGANSLETRPSYHRTSALRQRAATPRLRAMEGAISRLSVWRRRSSSSVTAKSRDAPELVECFCHALLCAGSLCWPGEHRKPA